MVSGFDSNVSRIQPRTKTSSSKTNVNKYSSKSGTQKNVPLQQTTIPNSEEIAKTKSKEDKPLNDEKKTNKEERYSSVQPRNSIKSGPKSPVMNVLNTPKDHLKTEQDRTPLSSNNNQIAKNTIPENYKSNQKPSDNPQLKEVEKPHRILHLEKFSTSQRSEKQNAVLPLSKKVLKDSEEITKDDTHAAEKDTVDIHEKFNALKKRLDAFINRDSNKSPTKGKSLVNADSIKDVIKKYQSQIQHLTHELTTLEVAHQTTREELSIVKKDLQDKSYSLQKTSKTAQERTQLAEELLQEMETAVFERDRAFTTIAELKSTNKSHEDLLSETYKKLEIKLTELEDTQFRERDLHDTIEKRNKEIQNLHILIAKRTAERDELLDRIDLLTQQINDFDKSRESLEEITQLINQEKYNS